MSSSSVYEPEEDEEASDSDVQLEKSKVDVPISSPPIQTLRLSPSPESDRRDASELFPRASLGTPEEVLKSLRKRLTKESTEAYTRLLEENVSEASPAAAFANAEHHNVTQNGAVIWSDKEKQVFFHFLARKGKDGVKEIADAIGSKSELEVYDHIKLLHKGLERQHLIDRHSRTIIQGEIPAALEISEECCAALDEYAELLCLEEQKSQYTLGKRRHKDFWIIDRERAEEVDEQLEEIEDVSTTGPSIFLTASLLNLKKWIQLSERFFMNFGGSRLEDNWVNVALEDETPSMNADAFSDFYALTVSITRRLIQSSLFFAMSRIRNMRDRGHSKAKVVRSRDVRAAIDVLNMKRDHSEFWTGLPRRCSLDVADFVHRKGWATKYMDLDEVEDILSGRMPLETRSPSREKSLSGRRAESMLQTDDDSDSSAASEELSSPAGTSDEEQPSDLEDDHAEFVDQKASVLEELHIWNTLKRAAPSSLTENGQDAITIQRPIGERKTKQELVDWRDRTLHKSEWEAYGYGLFEIDEIAENRRKRRRIQSRQSASRAMSSDSRDAGIQDRVNESDEEHEEPEPEQDLDDTFEKHEMRNEAVDKDSQNDESDDEAHEGMELDHDDDEDAGSQLEAQAARRNSDDADRQSFDQPEMGAASEDRMMPMPFSFDGNLPFDPSSQPDGKSEGLPSSEDEDGGAPLYSHPLGLADDLSD